MTQINSRVRILIDLSGESVAIIYFEKANKNLSWVRIFNSNREVISIQPDQAIQLCEALEVFKIFKSTGEENGTKEDKAK